MSYVVSVRVLFALLLICCVSACGEATYRKAITGSVSLKKEPLSDGIIQFTPMSGGSSEYPATKESGMIAKGEYKIPAEVGLVPGKYRVVITSGDGGAPADPDQPPGPSGNYVMKDRIPPEYNVKSTVEVEVTQAGPNQFNFEIP